MLHNYFTSKVYDVVNVCFQERTCLVLTSEIRFKGQFFRFDKINSSHTILFCLMYYMYNLALHSFITCTFQRDLIPGIILHTYKIFKWNNCIEIEHFLCYLQDTFFCVASVYGVYHY